MHVGPHTHNTVFVCVHLPKYKPNGSKVTSYKFHQLVKSSRPWDRWRTCMHSCPLLQCTCTRHHGGSSRRVMRGIPGNYFCREKAHLPWGEMVERNLGESKTWLLFSEVIRVFRNEFLWTTCDRAGTVEPSGKATGSLSSIDLMSLRVTQI